MMNFWEFIRERIAIYHKKQDGQPRPWTEDRVLNKYYFCNIYREWDKTTIWFKDNLRDPLKDNESVIFATVIFRWFNRIETAVRMGPELFVDWDSKEAKKRLRGYSPVVTGAYIIKTPNDMNKLDGVCWCIDQMWKRKGYVIDLMRTQFGSLEMMHSSLLEFPYMGDFMAYEVVTDLRHTKIGEQARDVNTWGNPGPGCKRGLKYVFHESVFNKQERLRAMINLLQQSWDMPDIPKMELRDIESSLCEYSKYVAGHHSGKLKRLYRGSQSDGSK